MRCHNFESTLRLFFLILDNESGQEVHENYIISFSKKLSLAQLCHLYDSKMTRAHNSAFVLSFFYFQQ